MSEHPTNSIERHCDVAIVGGSAAGLAVALQLGRQRRSVIVIDSGEPRNAPATHMHSFLGRDGQPPSELLAAGRQEVRSYGGEVLAGRVERVTRADDGGFDLELAGGHTIRVRRVLAATGLRDVLPEIEGLAERWGKEVIHCPFCHGFEVRDRRIVQIVTNPMGLHTAVLFRGLTANLTVVLHDPSGVDTAQLEALQVGGVEVRHDHVVRVAAGSDGHAVAVELEGGERIDADAVVVAPRFLARAEAFTSLGLQPTPHPTGLGDFVETDETGQTAVPGVYAAGNVTDPSHQVLQAAAHGSRVGAMISFSFAHEDLEAVARPSANEADWDHRYTAGPMWSGNPNGTLVNEASAMAPGRALDVGAGEGADALWLAEHGWKVTASDISQRALDRINAEAERRGLHIDYLHTDANALEAFLAASFDLVSAQYASIPRTPDNRGVHNLLDAVASGGSLLVVNHDLEAMREHDDPTSPSQAFDPDAYVRVEHVAESLSDASEWHVEMFEKRPRPPGAASASHHVDDIVLRARRHGQCRSDAKVGP